MAKTLKRTINGKTVYLNLDEVQEELDNMTKEDMLKAGARLDAFDNIVILPCGDKRFESDQYPGKIEAIEDAEQPGQYYPIDIKGLPNFSIILNDNGFELSSNKS